MNKRINRNGITRVARGYHLILERYIRETQHELGISLSTLFDVMVTELADMLEDDNENFDRDRFYNAVYQGK